MGTLPQLGDEDVAAIRAVLKEFLAQSEAEAVLVSAEGGFVVFHEGEERRFDVTSLGALAANAFCANQAIAELICEPSFSTLYQQGERHSLLVRHIDAHHALIVIFPSKISAGAVKHYAAQAAARIAASLQTARERNPSAVLDAAMLNMADSTDLFKRKRE